MSAAGAGAGAGGNQPACTPRAGDSAPSGTPSAVSAAGNSPTDSATPSPPLGAAEPGGATPPPGSEDAGSGSGGGSVFGGSVASGGGSEGGGGDGAVVSMHASASLNGAPAVPLPDMDVAVVFHSGKRLPMTVAAMAMVEDIMARVHKVCGLPAGQQELWLGTKQLSVGRALRFYGIGSGAELTLQFRVFHARHVLLTYLISSLPYANQQTALVHEQLVFVWDRHVTVSAPDACMKVAEIVPRTGALYVVPGKVQWEPTTGTLSFAPARRLAPFTPHRVYFYAAFFAHNDDGDAEWRRHRQRRKAAKESAQEEEAEKKAQSRKDEDDARRSRDEEKEAAADAAAVEALQAAAAAASDAVAAAMPVRAPVPAAAVPTGAGDSVGAASHDSGDAGVVEGKASADGEDGGDSGHGEDASTPASPAAPAAAAPIGSPSLADRLAPPSGILMGDETLDFVTGGFPTEVVLHIQALETWFTLSPKQVLVRTLPFPVGIKSFQSFMRSVAQLSAVELRKNEPRHIEYGALKQRHSVWRKPPRLSLEVGVATADLTKDKLMEMQLPPTEQDISTDHDVWGLPKGAVVRVRGLFGYAEDVGV